MSRPVRYGSSLEEANAGLAASDNFFDELPDFVRNGRMINGVTRSAAGTENVHHSLGRVPHGWMFMKIQATAPVTIYCEGANATIISVRFSAAGSCDVWVW